MAIARTQPFLYLDYLLVLEHVKHNSTLILKAENVNTDLNGDRFLTNKS